MRPLRLIVARPGAGSGRPPVPDRSARSARGARLGLQSGRIGDPASDSRPRRGTESGREDRAVRRRAVPRCAIAARAPRRAASSRLPFLRDAAAPDGAERSEGLRLVVPWGRPADSESRRPARGRVPDVGLARHPSRRLAMPNWMRPLRLIVARPRGGIREAAAPAAAALEPTSRRGAGLPGRPESTTAHRGSRRNRSPATTGSVRTVPQALTAV